MVQQSRPGKGIEISHAKERAVLERRGNRGGPPIPQKPLYSTGITLARRPVHGTGQVEAAADAARLRNAREFDRGNRAR